MARKLVLPATNYDDLLLWMKQEKEAQDALQYLLDFDVADGVELDAADRCVRTVAGFLVAFQKRYGGPIR
jgi:hypothetical protein